MKFLADIPIGQATMEYLRASGHDVVHVGQRLPATSSDPDIIRLAAAESRTILCFDLGMAELVAISRERLPSVITFRTRRHHAVYVNNRLNEILPELADKLSAGVLVTVEESRVRIRTIPIQTDRV